MRTCVKCGVTRSMKYMQEAVFRNFIGDEGVDIWKCSSSQTCKKNRKEKRRV